ncbi:MAG: hypothetical protein ABIE43_02265 [Patescibacteria group bacterium]
MKSEELIKQLNKYNKAYYTIADIELITGQLNPVVRVLLNRMAKNNKLIRLQKNIYITKEKLINYELIAQQIDSNCYTSFETILSQAGILSQVPYAITLASTKRSKKITLGNQEISYRKIKKSLAFGYYLENNVKTAYPEKALLDTLYLVSRGKLSLSLNELDFSSVNRKRLKNYINKYPKNIREMCKKLKLL